MAKILVIRNSALGDVAMTLPVLYSVAAQYPDTEFYLLTRPFFAKIFEHRPSNLHIIGADFKKEYKGINGLYRLIRELDKYKFTAVADLHNVLRSWIIDAAYRLRGKKVAMVDKKRDHRLTKADRTQQQSFIERYADTFSRLGYPVSLTFKSIYSSAPATPPIQVNRPAVGIAPFARYANKTYPIQQMEQVIEMLDKEGVNVYLFGAKGEESNILAAIAQRYAHVTNLAGKMPITDELSAISQMDVMVSMDSANQHLASIVGTPVISVWGSTTPGCGFYGYRQSADNAVCIGLDCQPCTVAGSKKCRLGTLACLRQIEPKTIVDKIMTLLTRP